MAAPNNGHEANVFENTVLVIARPCIATLLKPEDRPYPRPFLVEVDAGSQFELLCRL